MEQKRIVESKYISPWVFTTTVCNLKCPYCYVRQDGRYMDDRTYERMNDVFCNMLTSGEKDLVIYRLAGGEPLLAFNRWRPHMDKFLERTGDNGFVCTITNLTELTDEMISYFRSSNRFSFGVSLDGFDWSKPFHNGESSAEVVKKNIDRLLDAGKSDIDVSTVVDKKSFEGIEKLADWIAERDLKWGVYLDHFFCGEMDGGVIVERMRNVIDILDSHGYDILNKFKFNNIKINSLYEGCTAGEKLITVFVNGDVFPCQTTVYQEPICNIFDTDDIIGELKRQNKYKLGYNFELPEKCRSCSIAKICGGGCKQNNKEINKNYTCDIMKVVILRMFETSVNKLKRKLENAKL